MNQIPPNELLSAYLDGEVTPEQRTSVEAMLAQNPESRQLAAELKGLGNDLRSLPRLQLPAGFAERVVRAAERRVLDPQSVAANPVRGSAGFLSSAPIVPVATPASNEFVPEIVIETNSFEAALTGGDARTTSRWQVWQFAVGAAISAALMIAAFKIWNPAANEVHLVNSPKGGANAPERLPEDPLPPFATTESNETSVAHFDWGKGEDGKASPPADKLVPGPERVVASNAVKNGDSQAIAPAGAAKGGAENRSAVIIAYVAKSSDARSQTAAVERFEKFLKDRQVALAPAGKRVVGGVNANRNNAVNPRDRSVAGEKSPVPAAGNNSRERAYVIEGTPAELQAALELFKSLTGDADAKLAVEPLGNGQVSVPHDNLSYGTPVAPAGEGTRRALFIFRMEDR